MGSYTLWTLVAVGTTLFLEVALCRTGVLKTISFWIAMAIVWGFQVLVDGWLTKLSSPIVIYERDQFSGVRIFFDSPLEDFGFGFALVASTIILWEWIGKRRGRSSR